MALFDDSFYLWEYLQTAEKPVVIYGMGDGCEKIMRVCETYGIPVAGIFASDEYVRGHTFLGLPVLRYAEAKERFGSMIVLLAFAAFELGLVANIKRIAGEQELYAPDVPLFGGGLFERGYAQAHRAEFAQAYAMLVDETSRCVFRSVLSFKASGKIEYLLNCETPKQEAYDAVLRLGPDECCADLGAYDGDTVREFLAATGGRYRSIHALEPNPKNFAKLERTCGELPRVSLYQKGAWNRAETLCFNAKAGRSSAIQPGAKNMIEAEAVDALIREPLSFIKFDVEGAEREALEGCARQLAEHRPKLAVSAYHRNEDLFALPLQIAAVRGDYRVYLRHHPYIPAWDTVYYMV